MTPALRVEALTVGWCTVPSGALRPSGAGASRAGNWFAPARCPALVLLIHHPTHGAVLMDTGYAPRFFTTTAGWPERGYALTTPVTLPETMTLRAQLATRGLAPGDIRHVLVTHGHADHVAGLCDLPQATLYVRQEAIAPFEALRRAPFGRVRATRAAWLPALWPEDALPRTVWLEPRATTEVPAALQPLLGVDARGVSRRAYDVFGDHSLLAVDIPGHAPGMIALAMTTAGGPLLAVADAVWLADTLTPGAVPSWVERRMAWDAAASAETLRRLQQLRAASPEWTLLPSHDEKAIAAFSVRSAA